MSIKDNLQRLRALVEAQPEQLFNLGAFRQEGDCGTLFCTAGLAAQDPHFQALGVVWAKNEQAPSGWVVQLGGKFFDDSGADEMFGPDAWDQLFSTRGGAKGELYSLIRNVSDKQLALRRIDNQLKALT